MKNGFTLIELLVVIIILSLLIIITVPAYSAIYNSIKRNSFQNKITEIETAAQKYGNSIKDEIKKSSDSCLNTDVATLIKKGYLESEEEYAPVMYNPIDNRALEGDIRICYCSSKFDIQSYYVVEFNKNLAYHVGDVVMYNNKMYKCVIDYTNKSGIFGTNSKGKNFFEEVTC